MNIFEITYNQIILEALKELNDDIEFMYKIIDEQLFEPIKRNKANINQMKGITIRFNSKEFNSKSGKEAHNRLPINVIVSFENKANEYNLELNQINIYLNETSYKFIIEFIQNENLSYFNFQDKTQLNKLGLSQNQINLIWKHIDPISIKGSLAHELSHWVRDALGEDRFLKNVKTGKSIKPLVGKLSPIEAHFELDAQLHKIKQYKDKYKDDWNSLSIIDLANLIPHQKDVFNELIDIVNDHNNKDHYNNYMKKFFKRMANENLLGNNMKMLSFEQFKKDMK